MGQEDEVVLNVLLAEGLDVPTALAGASSDYSCKPSQPAGLIANQPRPSAPQHRRASASRTTGALIGLAAALAYLVWRSF